ncbi:MAG TPA: sugar ABC transporter permease, partial [Solirubrobacterales bacterium]
RQLGVLFLLPFVVLSLGFVVYPAADAIRLGFHTKLPFRNTFTFVGLDNFRYLVEDPVFWAAARQSCVWTAASIALQTVFGVAIALLLHQAVRGINVFRGLLLFPYMVPTVVIALIWRWMFNPELGIVNAGLRASGLVDGDIYWFSDPAWAMVSTILLNVWKFTPFVVICVLARLQTIPVEIVEAAQVDGAGAWRRFVHITLPALRPSFMLVVIYETMMAIRHFDLFFILTEGGPAEASHVLAWHVYVETFRKLSFGTGSALAYIMALVTFLLAFWLIRTLGRKL